ncbi:ATP-binding response regulator [Gaetbulibacter aestuarii]|uniref:histidine kinase n=1 Tax=Gaetbulibacter aestuarii TaxID=1502358 RepID=A0ABW7MY71_9FLAO
MKLSLLVWSLTFSIFSYAQSERSIIYKIDSINSSAQQYLNDNKIVESFKIFNRSKKLADSIDDSYGKAVASYNLGKIYMKMHAFEDAERSFRIVLGQANKLNNNFLLAQSYLNLGQITEQTKSTSLAIVYLEKALSNISKCDVDSNNTYDESECYDISMNIRTKLSEYYLKVNDDKKAISNLLQVEKLLIRKRDPQSMYYKGYINYLYGIYYEKEGFYNSAIEKYNIAISYLMSGVKNDNLEINTIYSKIYKRLSNSYAMANKNGEAYKALLQYNNFTEKMLEEVKNNNEVITMSRLSIEDYKNRLSSAKSEELYQIQKANNMKTINLIIVFALILLVISILVLYRSYASNRRLTAYLANQNKELEVARKEAVKSSEMKSKFISNVTHELRTPLYGVVGITSLLLEKNNLNSKDNKLLSSLKFSGDYLLNLVNEVLQFSKVESEKLELKLTTINIRDLIKNNISSFSYRLQETNNLIKVSIDEDVPNYVKCDSVRLSQVLLNLIGNSIKFTESGIIYVRIKTLNLNNNKAHLRFEVEDNGLGIPKDKFEAIFENFSQLDRNMNINYQGTGLGLSISKRIVELFGSQIELESEEGEGAKFSFNVTLDIDNEKQISETNEQSSGKIVDFKKKFNILIAEDNKINQIVTKNLLKRQNYSCNVVENGEDAVEFVKNNYLDLILMDINMPKMDGIKATELIREFNPNIPIIALTAADIDYVRTNYNEIGFSGILTKPFDNIEFFQMIETKIKESRADEKNALKVS